MKTQHFDLPINKSNLFIIFRFLAEFTSRASTLITFPILARYLGTEGYGVNTQTNTLITFLVPIATLGLGFGVVRLIAGKQSIQAVSSRLYSTLFVVGFVSFLLSILVYLAAPLLNQLFIKVEWATSIIRWSTPLIFLTAIEQAIKDYYRARLRIIAYSIFQMIQTIAYVAGVALVLSNGGGLLQVVWLWLAIKVIFNLSTFIYFILVGEIDVKLTFMPREELIGLLRFGFPIVVAGLGTWVTSVGDRWIIGYFMTISDVAVYNAAYTLAGIITALASPFWNPLYPLMSGYHNDNNQTALFHASRKYTNGFSLITIPAVIGLILLANPLLVKFGSPDFSINPITFGLIILGLFINQFSASIQYQIYLHNDPHFIRNATLISGGANVVFNLIAVPFLGIAGAAVATFLSYFLLNYLLFKKVKSYGNHIGDYYDFRTLSKYFTSSIIMGIVLIMAMQFIETDLITLFLLAALGVVAYGMSLFAMYQFNLRKLLISI